jgi:adenosylcobinamide-GDP ribazoletransferase
VNSPVNSLRLIFGTLTILPVRMPTTVDRAVAGRALTLAPLAGFVLALIVGVPVALLDQDTPPLLLAGLVVAALAYLTRAIHLDGLADTADGLGSGRIGEPALEVMKKSDIGPFGVVALMLALLLQVAALSTCLAVGDGVPALVLALVLSRAMLVRLGTSAFPAARSDGLGSAMAGSVTTGLLAAGLALAVVLAAGGVAVHLALGGSDPRWQTYVAALVGLLPALVLAETARNRFGGVTGDVYGACVETAFTGVLVAVALVTGLGSGLG